MDKSRRTERVNSLLIEVLNETLRKDVKNPHIHPMTTILGVDTSEDLHHAKVYFSVMDTPAKQQETLQALNSAAGFIAVQSSKRVRLHFFPELIFKLDTSGEYAARIEELLRKVLPSEPSKEASFGDESEASSEDESIT